MSTGRKKLARAAAIFAAVALTLTACSSGGDKASAPASSAGGKLPTGQTLSVWTFGATGLEDSMNKWAADTGNKVEFKKSEFDPHHEHRGSPLICFSRTRLIEITLTVSIPTRGSLV